MTPLIWSVLLLLLAILLVVIELIIPSGGLISLLAIAAAACSIALVTLQYGYQVGAAYFSLVALAAPFIVIYLIRWLPRSAIGEQIMNLPAEEDREVEPPRSLPRDLVGKIGRAKSIMLPGGVIEVEGRSYDAVSRGLAIDPGQAVRVVDVDGMRLLVQPVSDGPSSPQGLAHAADQPMDQVIPDPFE